MSHSVRDKINLRMDHLQKLMETNRHLDMPNYVTEHIETVTKFWSALSEEDRDYIEGARYAIEHKMHWDVSKKEDDIEYEQITIGPDSGC